MLERTGRLLALATLVLVLTAGTAPALTLETSDGGTNATAIRDLAHAGETYDVVFLRGTGLEIYGPRSGADFDSFMFDFMTSGDAEAALDSVLAALNTDASVETVGPAGSGSRDFDIPYVVSSFDNVITWWGGTELGGVGSWIVIGPKIGTSYTEPVLYAKFSVVPEPSTGWMLALGLVGLGRIRARRPRR